MKHVFSVVGVGLAAVFVVVFFTGRVDSKHMAAVAPRVGMHVDDLNALVPRLPAKSAAALTISGQGEGRPRAVQGLHADVEKRGRLEQVERMVDVR